MTPDALVDTAAPERVSPLELPPDDFRRLGHDLVDRIADFLGSLRDRPLTAGETPTEIRALLGRAPLPRAGAAPGTLLPDTAQLLFDHSLFNGHPRFMGYITSSAAPLGMLADLLAASVNPNVGGWELSPMASEIEAQTVRWVAELVGYPADCGGLLVSGGNMANFVCFLAGRRAMLGEATRTNGVGADGRPLRVYASAGTHTWIQKAADLFGLGTDAIRWIPTDGAQRLRADLLRECIRQDLARGDRPIMVVGTAGSVNTGAVDPLRELAEICRAHGLWFHVDGAYGAPAAVLPDAPDDLHALELADSLAVDPHKWLYAPLEAGCVLVREPQRLNEAFGYTPAYYRFGTEGDEPPINYYELGMQNSRGFRALKVWLGLRQAGREGYERMIGRDAGPEHRDLSVRAARSPRRRRRRVLPQRAQRGAARPAQDRRRPVRHQRRARRSLPAPRLHRELPDDRDGRGHDPGDRGAGGPAGGRGAPPREERLGPTSSTSPPCSSSARTSS
jgi:aromatic-L-amino-acid decarboxylase